MNLEPRHIMAIQRRHSYLTWLIQRPDYQDRHGELLELEALDSLLPILLVKS
jgi:hypothetical protein